MSLRARKACLHAGVASSTGTLYADKCFRTQAWRSRFIMRLLHRAAPPNDNLLVAFVLIRTNVERGFIGFARAGRGQGG
jgi:hypothetical protein